MHHLFTLPTSLTAFIQSLDAPPRPDDTRQPVTWQEPGTENTTSTGPHPYPPSVTWLAARDAYMGHVMTCPHCVTHGPRIPRHCPAGAELRRQYDATPFDDHAQNQPDNKIK
ncbi:hypothetical protein D7N47_17605 [Salmonella enterica subsp. enterica]|nr:hypothetical protein [Salmonella enterica subsp. enterica serovar Richmond]EDW1241160.1 hypothetical protein [Salmonella enterica subsp. enterica serovar Richmond]